MKKCSQELCSGKINLLKTFFLPKDTQKKSKITPGKRYLNNCEYSFHFQILKKITTIKNLCQEWKNGDFKSIRFLTSSAKYSFFLNSVQQDVFKQNLSSIKPISCNVCQWTLKHPCNFFLKDKPGSNMSCRHNPCTSSTNFHAPFF